MPARASSSLVFDLTVSKPSVARRLAFLTTSLSAKAVVAVLAFSSSVCRAGPVVSSMRLRAGAAASVADRTRGCCARVDTVPGSSGEV